MIDDPYKVLGLSPNASQEEIKKAYRRKAKEFHPDLHPNDPNASKKMNDVNEAYDMLMNPEKYTAKRAQQQQQQQARNPYGGYSGQQGSSNNYQGPGGWASDFNGFNFGDIFGFGGAQDSASTRPQAESGDSREIQYVVSTINSGRYQDAIRMLTQIPSTGRNARWYYLSALANHGLGNSVQKVDHMQKAVLLDPNNRTYQQLLHRFEQSERTQAQATREVHMPMVSFGKIFRGFIVARIFFELLRFLLSFGMQFAH